MTDYTINLDKQYNKLMAYFIQNNAPVECRVQLKYCISFNLPYHLPLDGNCPTCGKWLFMNDPERYRAGKDLINGCPHCKKPLPTINLVSLLGENNE